MLEHIHGISQRIAALKVKLKAREGKTEFQENCEAIRAEIERLEGATKRREVLEEFVAGETLASSEDQEPRA